MAAPHCAFDALRTKFALVHNNCVRVYDVATGKLEKTLTPPNSMSHIVTSLSWGDSAQGQPLVAVGCASGSAFAWNLATDEQVLEAQVSQAVKAVEFQPSTKSLLVATARDMRAIPLAGGDAVEAALPKGTESVAATAAGAAVAVGAKKLSVVDVAAGKKFAVRAKYTGHAGVATGLCFFEGGRRFASFAEGERHVSVWNVPDAAAAAAAGASAQAQAPAASLQLLQKPLRVRTAGAASVLCVTEADGVQVFDLEADASVVVRAAAASSGNSILDAHFLSADEVLVAKGSRSAPVFERVRIREGGRYLEEVKVDLSAEAVLLPVGGATKRRRAADEADSRPIASSSINEAALEKAISQTDSLGFKRAELLRRQAASGAKAASEKVRLTQALQQALSTKDVKVLNDLLSEGIRRNVIDVSVQALDRKSALQLLRECIKRFQHKSTMAQDMSVIESHVGTFNQLAMMKGRLDIVIGRSNALSDTVLKEHVDPLHSVSEADIRAANSLLPFEDADDLPDAAAAAAGGSDDDDDELSGADSDDELGQFLKEQGLAQRSAAEVEKMQMDGDEEEEEVEEVEEDEEEGEEEEA